MKRKNILFSIVIISIMNMPLVAMQERNALVTKAQKAWKTFKKDMRCASKWNCTPEQRNRLIKQGLVLAAIVGSFVVGVSLWSLRLLSEQQAKKRYDEVMCPLNQEASEKVVANISEWFERNSGTWRQSDEGTRLDKALRGYRESYNAAKMFYNRGSYRKAYDRIMRALEYIKRAQKLRTAGKEEEEE